ncbi:MAG: restriction endonuclease subunit M [Alcaligenaceae bacterium]|nr:restriction endonuclease subunit M [Alcaligenaceae bacterium]
MGYDEHKKCLVQLIRQAASNSRVATVFADFVECAAIDLSNILSFSEERAERFKRVMVSYSGEERSLFPKMLGHLVMALEDRLGDVLGEVYMELGLANEARGQFFTPYSVCLLMAKLNSDPAAQVSQRGFVTANDPACGAGATLIAFADHMRSEGMNFQKQLHVVATDVDIQAVHMCYLQLSVIGVPAIVIHGNSLTLKEHGKWHTPFHHIGFWESRLAARGA